MNLADEMLLAQMRESVLQDIPEEQWSLVVNEVEKAGGVRQVQGYSKVLLHNAIVKASFGGNRSEAGRYAANVRWQSQGQSGAGIASDKQGGFAAGKKYERQRGKFRVSDPSKAPKLEDMEVGVSRGNKGLQFEELKEGNIADELPNSMPPEYNDYGDEPINPMPPEYNDYGDEPSDDERARRALRAMSVPIDLRNPKASQANTTPDSPKKRKKKNS